MVVFVDLILSEILDPDKLSWKHQLKVNQTHTKTCLDIQQEKHVTDLIFVVGLMSVPRQVPALDGDI
jgi:hypothetical protein